MKPQFPRPTRFLAACVACAAALFLAACDTLPISPNSRQVAAIADATRDVSNSGFEVGDLLTAFRNIWFAIDGAANERFGPDSGNYQRVRRSVPVKVMMLSPSNQTPYEFDMGTLERAQLRQIKDNKDSLWTRYTPSDPTRLRTAETDWKLMFRAYVALDRATSTAEAPRFLYKWKLTDMDADGKVIAQGEEPLRAQAPASLRLKPETR